LALQVGLPPVALALWEHGSLTPHPHLLRLATLLAADDRGRPPAITARPTGPARNPAADMTPTTGKEHQPQMTPPTAPTTGTPATTTAGSRQVPSFGGSTLRGRSLVTDGHQLATATPHPGSTVTAGHRPHAPLRRLRCTVAYRPLPRVPVGCRWVPARPRPHPPTTGRHMPVTPGSDPLAVCWPDSGPHDGQPSARGRARW
jgi:hypothetical protein